MWDKPQSSSSPGLTATAWVLTALIVAFAVGVLWYAGQTGEGAREFGRVEAVEAPRQGVHVVGTAEELYSVWKERGVRGRAVINLSRFFHYVPIPVEEVVQMKHIFPIETFPLAQSYEGRVSHENVLWVAMQGGIIRKAHHVLPEREYEKRFSGFDFSQPGVRRDGDTVITSDYGSPRYISYRFPEIQAPVLMNIDASFLDDVDPARLLADLRRSGIRTDLVTLCLSRDNPEVTDAGREKLLLLAGLLRE
jgi:hypothetical protein